MTTENIVKVLSKEKQVKSISRGKSKLQKKKIQFRKVIESPFILELPNIEEKDHELIKQLVKDAFQGMKKITFRPPWQLCSHLKGQEQKDFISNYIQTESKKANEDPKFKEQMQIVTSLWDQLILGYNAVMRGIEKGNVAAVILEKNTKPSHLSSTFLPACANNGVPLLTIEGLQDIAKDEHYLGINYSCMVIGFKHSVKEEKSKFNHLYNQICSTLNFEEIESEEMEVDEELNESTNTSHSHTEEKKDNFNHFLLKRPSTKIRAFIPEIENEQYIKKFKVENEPSADFISFGSSETKNNTSQYSNIEQGHSNNIVVDNLLSSDMFSIDPEGNNTCLEKSNINNSTVMNKAKKKKKNTRYHEEYKPATVISLKSNIKRQEQ